MYPKEMWDERNWCATIGGNGRGSVFAKATPRQVVGGRRSPCGQPHPWLANRPYRAVCFALQIMGASCPCGDKKGKAAPKNRMGCPPPVQTGGFQGPTPAIQAAARAAHRIFTPNVPQTGLEPVQPKQPGDFKSPASTIPPLWQMRVREELKHKWSGKSRRKAPGDAFGLKVARGRV